MIDNSAKRTRTPAFFILQSPQETTVGTHMSFGVAIDGYLKISTEIWNREENRTGTGRIITVLCQLLDRLRRLF